MNNALIGYTGFVGGNLASQKDFEFLFNSKNSDQMRGRQFSEVVCAGVSAVKWMANKAPQGDLQNIKKLADTLATIQAERFILISTIDVYPDPGNAEDETANLHGLDNHAYGTNRLWFEDFCKETFPNCHIVRLPGLFGTGLKKNVIFDLLNDNCLEMINPASSYQYYYLKNLWADICKIIDNDIKLVNLFNEPVATSEIINNFFPSKEVGQKPAPEGHYNLRTCHADLWGKSIPYIYSREEVLSQMKEFIEQYRKENKK